MQHKTLGVTMMVRVPVGAIAAAEEFYATVIGRGPDFRPTDDFREWELTPDAWLLVAEGAPPQNGRIRFGVVDIEEVRRRLAEQLGIEVTDVERLDGIVAWCNFSDPWGNQLGLFKDLQRWEAAAPGQQDQRRM